MVGSTIKIDIADHSGKLPDGSTQGLISNLGDLVNTGIKVTGIKQDGTTVEIVSENNEDAKGWSAEKADVYSAIGLVCQGKKAAKLKLTNNFKLLQQALKNPSSKYDLAKVKAQLRAQGVSLQVIAKLELEAGKNDDNLEKLLQKAGLRPINYEKKFVELTTRFNRALNDFLQTPNKSTAKALSQIVGELKREKELPIDLDSSLPSAIEALEEYDGKVEQKEVAQLNFEASIPNLSLKEIANIQPGKLGFKLTAEHKLSLGEQALKLIVKEQSANLAQVRALKPYITAALSLKEHKGKRLVFFRHDNKTYTAILFRQNKQSAWQLQKTNLKDYQLEISNDEKGEPVVEVDTIGFNDKAQQICFKPDFPYSENYTVVETNQGGIYVWEDKNNDGKADRSEPVYALVRGQNGEHIKLDFFNKENFWKTTFLATVDGKIDAKDLARRDQMIAKYAKRTNKSFAQAAQVFIAAHHLNKTNVNETDRTIALVKEDIQGLPLAGKEEEMEAFLLSKGYTPQIAKLAAKFAFETEAVSLDKVAQHIGYTILVHSNSDHQFRADKCGLPKDPYYNKPFTFKHGADAEDAIAWLKGKTNTIEYKALEFRSSMRNFGKEGAPKKLWSSEQKDLQEAQQRLQKLLQGDNAEEVEAAYRELVKRNKGYVYREALFSKNPQQLSNTLFGFYLQHDPAKAFALIEVIPQDSGRAEAAKKLAEKALRSKKTNVYDIAVLIREKGYIRSEYNPSTELNNYWEETPGNFATRLALETRTPKAVRRIITDPESYLFEYSNKATRNGKYFWVPKENLSFSSFQKPIQALRHLIIAESKKPQAQQDKVVLKHAWYQLANHLELKAAYLWENDPAEKTYQYRHAALSAMRDAAIAYRLAYDLDQEESEQSLGKKALRGIATLAYQTYKEVDRNTKKDTANRPSMYINYRLRLKRVGGRIARYIPNPLASITFSYYPTTKQHRRNPEQAEELTETGISLYGIARGKPRKARNIRSISSSAVARERDRVLGLETKKSPARRSVRRGRRKAPHSRKPQKTPATKNNPKAASISPSQQYRQSQSATIIIDGKTIKGLVRFVGGEPYFISKEISEPKKITNNKVNIDGKSYLVQTAN